MAVVDSEQLRAGRRLRLLLGPDDGGWVEHQWLPWILFRPSVWQRKTGHVQQQGGAVRKLCGYQGAAQWCTDTADATDSTGSNTNASSNNDAGSGSTPANTDTCTKAATSGDSLRA